MEDFCKYFDVSLVKEFEVEKGEQVWLTDVRGKYQEYQATLYFKSPVSQAEYNWKTKLIQLLDKWWWSILLVAVVYEWII